MTIEENGRDVEMQDNVETNCLLPEEEQVAEIDADDDDTDNRNLENIKELIEMKCNQISDDICEEYICDDSKCNIRHVIKTDPGCTHEVYYPAKKIFKPLNVNFKRAKEFSFTLDPFQRSAINCVANDQSVLVASHTSSGKTAVALYAIAVCLQNKQRVIYTSPIKALSNQKYRELYDEFEDVGLMTGDVTINSNANCLVMTTEILKSMIYRGAEIVKQVKWLIFDEIHYMRDPERGIVWEESIALLPKQVRFVFLSATISNGDEFADWICNIHEHPCNLVYTDYRPIPLQKYVYVSGDTGIHLVVKEDDEFIRDTYDAVFRKLESSTAKRNVQSDFKRLFKMIMGRDMAPVIVFTFSRKLCEDYALQISEFNFNDSDDRDTVVEIFNNAIDTLSDEDKNLVQVTNLLSLLKRGIGIHHSGLLPILKETVEILFSEGLVKALFATETFAMGVNMPARTVLFSDTQKFDGVFSRTLHSGEFIQMSGRAGRRSIDKKGIVIVMLNKKMDKEEGFRMLTGKADPLNSSFYLSYTMILNMIRVSSSNVNFLLQRTFYQFQNYKSIPLLVDKFQKLKIKYDALSFTNLSEYKQYYKIRKNIDFYEKKIRDIINKPEHIIPFLQKGRIIRIINNKTDFGWGVVIGFHNNGNETKNTDEYVVDCLVNIDSSCTPNMHVKQLCPPKSISSVNIIVLSIALETIARLSSIRMYFLNNLTQSQDRKKIYQDLQSIIQKFPDGLPLLDPVSDMGITHSKLKTYVENVVKFEERLTRSQIHKNKACEKEYNAFLDSLKMLDELKVIKEDIKSKKKILLIDQLKCRKSLLKRMQFINNDGIIEPKGKVGCNIASADPILLTELIFDKFFNDLEPTQIAALASCFVFQEKSNMPLRLHASLQSHYIKIFETAKLVSETNKECQIRDFDENKYLKSINPHMINIVYDWCNGASFKSILEKSDIYEGTIIKTMRRLEECLRELSLAAKTIEQTDLETKFTKAIELIKKDIVFAASLYL
ncbi:hypothetical protein A3Q56_02114 [Intoshia linei]|uniref:Uncharacterized protein n=1 Tax=Intoshia linei TaxID=1819745 RepID=A0A177B752_9BILA|nr:hypothetical protein A3Q56_02114 [Intoshia linei]